MLLPIFFIILILGFFLLGSLRISVWLVAKDTGITYNIQLNILKFIKVFEVKSGTRKRKKRRKSETKEKKRAHSTVYGIFSHALHNHKGKVLHIEKLDLQGTFSTKDAAANAILFGILMILWQWLLIFLTAHFSLEHQNFHILPDFQNHRNEMVLHFIFRIVFMKILFLILSSLMKRQRPQKKYSSL